MEVIGFGLEHYRGINKQTLCSINSLQYILTSLQAISLSLETKVSPELKMKWSCKSDLSDALIICHATIFTVCPVCKFTCTFNHISTSPVIL